MKNWIIVSLVCVVYFVIAVATSKDVLLPVPVCSNQINKYLRKDTTYFFGYEQIVNDTIVINALKDTSTIPQIAQDLCKIFRDSCGVTNKKILFVGNTSNTANPMTPYGRQLYITQCP